MANSGECVRCGTWRYSLHRDHIIPKHRGGSDEPENIQLLCANCHEDKTRKDMTGRIAGPPSEVTKEKIRVSLAGKVLSESHRLALRGPRQSMQGRPHSPEHNEAIRQARLGSKRPKIVAVNGGETRKEQKERLRDSTD